MTKSTTCKPHASVFSAMRQFGKGIGTSDWVLSASERLPESVRWESSPFCENESHCSYTPLSAVGWVSKPHTNVVSRSRDKLVSVAFAFCLVPTEAIFLRRGLDPLGNLCSAKWRSVRTDEYVWHSKSRLTGPSSARLGAATSGDGPCSVRLRFRLFSMDLGGFVSSAEGMREIRHASFCKCWRIWRCHNRVSSRARVVSHTTCGSTLSSCGSPGTGG